MIHTQVLLASLVTVVACAPAASPSDVEASSETTGDTTSSDDDGGNAEAASTAGMSSGSSSTSGATTSTSSGDATDDGSSSDAATTGGEASMTGRYLLFVGETTIVPDGCGSDSGPARNWSLELREPADDGSFSALETYGGFVNELACSLEDGGFGCTYEVSVDYAAMGGPDAAVHLTSRYEATWDDGAIAGVYAVEFACDGTECDAVAEQWNVVGFPCDIDVSFTGERDPRDDG